MRHSMREPSSGKAATSACGTIRSCCPKTYSPPPTSTTAEVKEETIIDQRYYHTIKEVKNGEGPHPIKTPKGWLHLAHGVRACAAGLRYVLYLYMTALDDPTRLIASPGGYFMAPEGDERVGDVTNVSNVLFSNGWIADEDGTVFIYYASSDTRMHVPTSTVDKLVDYCMNTPADGFSSSASVESLKKLIGKNLKLMRQEPVPRAARTCGSSPASNKHIVAKQ